MQLRDPPHISAEKEAVGNVAIWVMLELEVVTQST
jgi:hypothetical protein